MATQAPPYPSQIHVLTERSEQVARDVSEIKELVKDQNSRVKKLELWQASMRGAGQALRIGWLLAGGAVGAIIVELVKGSFS